MIKPTLQKPITIDSLQKYSIELEAYAYSLEVDCKELEVYKKLFDKMLMSEMQLNTSEENGELYKNLSNAFDKLSKNLEGAMAAMMHNAVSPEENEKERKKDE